MFRKIIRSFCSLKPEEIIDIGAQPQTKGILTICPTPIGNLQDFSIRQDQALFSADVIACEDTRHTGFLIKMLMNKKEKYLPELPESEQLDDDDFNLQDLVFENTTALQQKLPELNKEFVTEKDFRFFKQKRIEEMRERIEQHKQKEQEYLHGKDPLSFMGKNEELEQEFEVYGITAPFLSYLKNKIALAKKRKGRGILISCHKFNEDSRIDRLIAMLKMGLNVTLVSDAGTPAISDPGYRLVSKCIERNVQIEVIPGACAVTVALSASGFPADRFEFLGFLGRHSNEKQDLLLQAKKNRLTTVVFEASHRVHQLLLAIEQVYGEHQMVFLAFELTKMFEKKMRGRCRDMYETLTDPTKIKPSHLKGEVTVVIAPHSAAYNDDLRAQQVEQSEQKEDEESDQLMVKQVEGLHLAKVLAEKCSNLKDKELGEILQKSLRVSKNKAMKLVVEVRHIERVEESNQRIRRELGIEKDLFTN